MCRPGSTANTRCDRLVGEVHAVGDELHVRRPAGQGVQGGGDRAWPAVVQRLHPVEQMGDQGPAQGPQRLAEGACVCAGVTETDEHSGALEELAAAAAPGSSGASVTMRTEGRPWSSTPAASQAVISSGAGWRR